jgi:hypothetical protein
MRGRPTERCSAYLNRRAVNGSERNGYQHQQISQSQTNQCQPSSDAGTSGDRPSGIVETSEHRRFGEFCVSHPLRQMERILEINALQAVTSRSGD